MNDPVELRRKAEACRRLADIADTVERKVYWLERADEWERLAAKSPSKSSRLDSWKREKAALAGGH